MTDELSGPITVTGNVTTKFENNSFTEAVELDPDDVYGFSTRITKLSKAVNELSMETRHHGDAARELAYRLNNAWLQLNYAWLAVQGFDSDGQPLVNGMAQS